jgi:hypothetical protein
MSWSSGNVVPQNARTILDAVLADSSKNLKKAEKIASTRRPDP